MDVQLKEAIPYEWLDDEQRREDLKEEFLIPFRRKMEQTLSIPQDIVDDVDLEVKEKNLEGYLNNIGMRLLKDDEEIKRK